MRPLLAFLICWPLAAAVATSPTNCATRPCTYTVSCVAQTCDTAEKAEVRSLLDMTYAGGGGAPQRGDTIALPAGNIIEHTDVGDPYDIRKPAGSSGYLTITSTKAAECPADGQRITPAYADVVPWFHQTLTAVPAVYAVGTNDGTEAAWVKLDCIGFKSVTATNASKGPLQLGHSEAKLLTEYGTDISQLSHQAHDIIAQHLLFLSSDRDSQENTVQLVANCYDCTIQDSYLDGAWNRSGDTHTIHSWLTPGFTVKNTYIGFGTESVFLGGAGMKFDMAVADEEILFEHNYFPMVMERYRYEQWSAGKVVFHGKHIRPTAIDEEYVALNTGITGGVEPTWDNVLGNTTVDNDITWERVSNWPGDKNRFESKGGANVTLRHNVFDGTISGHGGQFNAIVAKSANQGNYSLSASCNPYTTGTVNTSGTTVTLVSGGPLPKFVDPETGYDAITIDSLPYTITDYQVENATTLTLSTTPSCDPCSGVTFTAGYLSGSDQCFSSWSKDWLIEHNIIRNSSTGISILDQHGWVGRIGDYLIRNNLMIISCNTWTINTGACGAFAWMAFATGASPPRVTYDHNTVIFDGSGDARGPWYSLLAEINYHVWDAADSAKITNNIASKAQYGGIIGQGNLNDTCCASNAGLAGWFADNGTPAENEFDQNMLLGVATAGFAGVPGTVLNWCPTASACTVDWERDDATYGILFQDYGAGEYLIRNGNALAKRTGTDGADLGADFSELPRIFDVQVTPTDDKALITWQVSAPLRDQSCTVSVRQGNWDWDDQTIANPGYISDQDPDTYTTPDSADLDAFAKSGLGRSYVVGLNSALSASTTYYYRIMCGGDAYPAVDAPASFTTAAALAGTKVVTVIHNRSGSRTLEYGTSYSRATDTISSGGTDVQSCSGSCSFSWTANRGDIYYYRLQGEDMVPSMIAVQ